MTPRTLSVLFCALLIGVGTAQDRPRLGVRLTLGVPVETVESDSAAHRAGLKPGDFIVSCDGEGIQDMEALVDWADQLGAGAKARMTVIRDGEQKTLDVSLPNPLPEGQKLGITVGTGFLVTSVSKGTPAAAAGLRVGDVLISFGGRAVESFEALRAEIAKVKPGAKKTVRVVRDGKELVLEAPFSHAETEPRSDVRRPRLLLPPVNEEEKVEEPSEEVVEEPAVPDEEIEEDFFGLPPIVVAESPRLTELAKELGAAMQELKAVAKKEDAVASALAKLEKVKKGLDALVRRRRGMDKFFRRGLEGFKGFPVLPPDLGGGIKGSRFDRMMEDLQQRVQELVEQGLGSEDINGILKKEFPDVKVRVHSDSAPAKKESPKKPKSSQGDAKTNESGR